MKNVHINVKFAVLKDYFMENIQLKGSFVPRQTLTNEKPDYWKACCLTRFQCWTPLHSYFPRASAEANILTLKLDFKLISHDGRPGMGVGWPRRVGQAAMRSLACVESTSSPGEDG